MGAAVGRVAQLWRYPVKSMGGAPVDVLGLASLGAHADRLWAVRDLQDERTTSARRLPVLLGCTARYTEVPAPDAGPGRATPVIVTLPDGEEFEGGDRRLDERLSELCRRPVALVPLPAADDRGRYRGGLVSSAAVRKELGLADDEPLPDASDMPLRTLATLARYATPPGMFVDLAPVHLITTAAVAALGRALSGDPEDDVDEHGPGGLSMARFRPTVVIETEDPDDDYPERAWVGQQVRLGEEALLPVTMPTVRCTIPTREQPGLDRRRRLTHALTSSNDRFVGVYADVAVPGEVRVGDPVAVVPRERNVVRSVATRARRVAVRVGSRVVDRL